MFGIIADLIASALTMLLPAYLSYKALRSHDPAQINPWLIYFTILSLALLFESWTVFILGWIPFYSWIRLFFLLYLVLPQTQGAKLLYLNYVEPFIVEHESNIDKFIGETHARLHQLGLGYLSVLIDFIREKVLGQQSPQPAKSQNAGAVGAGGAQGYAGFATDLMSRFAMPGARSAQPNTSAAGSGGVYGLMSNLAGAAFASATGPGGAGATSRSRDVSGTGAHYEAVNVPNSLLDDLHRSNLSNTEKSSMISQQRTRLTTLLKSLETEQQNLDLAYGGSSRSEQSYDKIDHDDLYSSHESSPRPRSQNRKSGGGGERDYSRHVSGGSNPPNNDPSWVPAGVSNWFAGSGSPPVDPSRSRSGHDDHDRTRDRYDDDYDRSRPSQGWNSAKDITDAISHGASSGYDRRRG